jgi:hypothetical protein
MGCPQELALGQLLGATKGVKFMPFFLKGGN